MLFFWTKAKNNLLQQNNLQEISMGCLHIKIFLYGGKNIIFVLVRMTVCIGLGDGGMRKRSRMNNGL